MKKKLVTLVLTAGFLLGSTQNAQASGGSSFDYNVKVRNFVTSRDWKQSEKNTMYMTSDIAPCKYLDDSDKWQTLKYFVQMQKKKGTKWKDYANTRLANACTDPKVFIWTDAESGKYRFRIYLLPKNKVTAFGSGTVYYNGAKP